MSNSACIYTVLHDHFTFSLGSHYIVYHIQREQYHKQNMFYKFTENPFEFRFKLTLEILDSYFVSRINNLENTGMIQVHEIVCLAD